MTRSRLCLFVAGALIVSGCAAVPATAPIAPSAVATVMDVSASARSFLAKATKAKEVEKLLRHHPNRKGDVLRKKLQSRSHDAGAPDPDAAGRES